MSRPATGAAASTSARSVGASFAVTPSIGRAASARAVRPPPSGPARRGLQAPAASIGGSSHSFSRLWRRRVGGEEEVARGVAPDAPPPPPAPAAVRVPTTLRLLLTPLTGLALAAAAVRAVTSGNLASGPAVASDPAAAERAALAREAAAAAAARQGRVRGAARRRSPAFSAALLSTRASVSLTRAIQAAEFGNTAAAMAELDRALASHAAAGGGVPLPSGAGAADTARLYRLFLQNTELPADFGALLALRDLLHMGTADAEALEAEVLSSGADFSI